MPESLSQPKRTRRSSRSIDGIQFVQVVEGVLRELVTELAATTGGRRMAQEGTEWADYLSNDRAQPPDAGGFCTATPDQRLLAFVRNARRELSLAHQATEHELHKTVAEVVGAATDLAKACSSARDLVHRSLHTIEDEAGQSQVSAATVEEVSTNVRRSLRGLEQQALEIKRGVNQLLQPVRMQLLRPEDRDGNGWQDDRPDNEAFAEVLRRYASASRILSEESYWIVVSWASDVPAVAENIAYAAHKTFKRSSDFVAQVGDAALSILVMDTPEEHCVRLIHQIVDLLANGEHGIEVGYVDVNETARTGPFVSPLQVPCKPLSAWRNAEHRLISRSTVA